MLILFGVFANSQLCLLNHNNSGITFSCVSGENMEVESEEILGNERARREASTAKAEEALKNLVAIKGGIEHLMEKLQSIETVGVSYCFFFQKKTCLNHSDECG